MSKWKFSCEMKESIPLPPDYTFAQAFNYLNAETNSFYVLTAPSGSYIQCGGDRAACTVEMREWTEGENYSHWVVGRKDGAETPGTIRMQGRSIELPEREVLDRWDAIELFGAFFAGDAIPPAYERRLVDL